MARVSKKRGERSGARSGLGSGRAGERMSTVLSGSAQPGAAAGLYSHSSQPYIQRLGIAGVSIQRLQAVPTPCRPLERAVPVPCQRAGIAAQARARGRAVLGTGTGPCRAWHGHERGGPGRFRTGPNQHRARAGPMGLARLEIFSF